MVPYVAMIAIHVIIFIHIYRSSTLSGEARFSAALRIGGSPLLVHERDRVKKIPAPLKMCT